MTFYDVIIDNTIEINNILEKEYNEEINNEILKIDLRKNIKNNYELLGSTANAIASLIEYDIPNYKCSRMYIYYNERIETETYNINNSINSIIKYNFCSEEEYEYNQEKINEEPEEEIYKKALENEYKFSILKIKKDLNNLLLSLINNEPFIITILIFESFKIENKEIKFPKKGEKEIGGITIIVYGYDIRKQIFIIKLLNNYYELPFIYLLKDNYSSDCYIFVLRNLINIMPKLIKLEEEEKEEEEIEEEEIDLRDKFKEIYDQGKISSCTANALTSIYEYDKKGFEGSRLFLYYNERLLINETHKDEGAYLSDGIKALKKYGICEEKYFPYIIKNVYKEPSKEAYENGKINYIIEAKEISNNIKEIKKWLKRNEPIVIGIKIYDNFMNSKTGKIEIPKENNKYIGGHAVIICGYKEKERIFIMRNSWGKYWGDKGYFYISYDYINNSELCGDLWIITRIFE